MRVREAEPGERCPCGKPAKAALIRQLGVVLTCKTPDEYREEVDRAYQMSRSGIARSAGQSGVR